MWISLNLLNSSISKLDVFLPKLLGDPTAEFEVPKIIFDLGSWALLTVRPLDPYSWYRSLAAGSDICE